MGPLATTLALGLGLALAGCSDSVEVAKPAIEGADVKTCEELVADAPEELFGQERREVSGASTTSAAWGDPAVLLECGAKAPESFDVFSSCSEIDGIGWYMPDAQLKDQGSDIAITAESHSPRVTVTIPAQYRRNSPDVQLGVLGELVGKHLEETKPCT